MPITPYHFGPNGFVGLALRKWIDVPAIILANVAVDMEVLIIDMLRLGHPIHRYCHTLLVGVFLGTALGLLLYPFRGFLERAMRFLGLDYKAGRWQMIAGGILGAWMHQIVDSIYHYDVLLFWPFSNATPLWNILTQPQVRLMCLLFWAAAIVLYIGLILKKRITRRYGKNC